MLGVPELSLSVTPLAARTFLFGKVYHVSDGEETLINNQVAPVAVEGTPGETRRVEWEPVGFQRQFRVGDTLRLALAATDARFASARRGAGVAIHHADSTLSLPVIGTPRGGNVGGSVSASSDRTAFTGGQHTRQQLSVEGGPTFVRDRTPDGWIVAAADRPYTRTSSPATEHNYVEFRDAVTDGDPEYIARAPEGPRETTVYTFGPVEVSEDGNKWAIIEGTDRSVLLVGQDT